MSLIKAAVIVCDVILAGTGTNGLRGYKTRLSVSLIWQTMGGPNRNYASQLAFI